MLLGEMDNAEPLCIDLVQQVGCCRRMSENILQGKNVELSLKFIGVSFEFGWQD